MSIGEFEFRYGFKDITDLKRFGAMLSVCEGRLKYRDLTVSKYTHKA